MQIIDIIDTIALFGIDGVGRRTIYKISKQHPKDKLNPRCIQDILSERSIFPSLKEISKAYEYAEQIIESTIKRNIHILTIQDDRFPSALKVIPNPPILLFIRGDYKFINKEKSCIAVIGTRQPTSYGRDISKMIGEYLAQKKMAVVSGLAVGCDTKAHIGCLQGKGKTAAVLAHGLDMIYPYENKRLSEEIISSGGCIISEYLPKQIPQPYTFIERNRIQTGLSQGLIVIETEKTGGTMHTVQFALKQNKKIGCIKYPDSFKKYKKLGGNEKILKDTYTIPIKNYRDIDYFINA
ncbi:MAG: DNA-processing protein DprA [Epulopiscium sp.]|nr:DNA-processing protein DprA [Candidatus Epulonipiscium sp.]